MPPAPIPARSDQRRERSDRSRKNQPQEAALAKRRGQLAVILHADVVGSTAVPADKVAAFKSAMQDAGVDLVFNGYDGVRHGFTKPDAGSFGIDNLKYDEAADTASWRSMLQTFNAVF